MANYAHFSLRKLSTTGAINAAYNHNYRVSLTENVNPARSHLNDEAVKLDAADYMDAFEKRFRSLDYYKDHKLRKDAVKAMELTLEYSPEAAGTFDVDEWKKANVEWLQETFGKDNVVSVMFHYDEGVCEATGAIHGHAIVIPVDDRGHICAKSFVNGKNSLVEMHDSYARAMEPFGLSRSLKGMHMPHEKITQIYAKAADEMEKTPIPVKLQGETDHDYAERLKKQIDDMRAANVRTKALHEKEIREIKAQNRTRTEDQKDKRIAYLEKENERLEGRIKEQDDLVRERGGIDVVIRKAEDLDMLNYGIQNHPDDQFAAAASDSALKMIEWARKEKKRTKEINTEQAAAK